MTMNYSVQQQNQQIMNNIPMTTSSSSNYNYNSNNNRCIRRLLPKTPVSKKRQYHYNNNMVATIGKKPRSSCHGKFLSPYYHRKRLYNNNCSTPSNTGNDRFIPNRAKTDVAKARRALVGNNNEEMKQHPNQLAYQRNLRRVLFDDDDSSNSDFMNLNSSSNNNNNNFFMSYGPTATTKKNTTTQSAVHGNNSARAIQRIWDEDILRPMTPLNIMTGESKLITTAQKPKVRIEKILELDAPGILSIEGPTLTGSFGGIMAVALDDTAYLQVSRDEIIPLTDPEENDLISFVQWSNDGKYVALGYDGFIRVYTVVDQYRRVCERSDPVGWVTALAWGNDMNIVVAGENGIYMIDLKDGNAVPSTFHHHVDKPVTALVWNTSMNIIVSGGGGNEIKVFDATKKGNDIAPKFTMTHGKVKSLFFCPKQPNILVSAGEGGLHFWNIHDGKLRASIKTESRVIKAMIPDANYNEILVATYDELTLWQFSPSVRKLCSVHISSHMLITGMTEGPNGSIVCTTTDESLSLFRLDRHELTRNRESDIGKLKMPVIR